MILKFFNRQMEFLGQASTDSTVEDRSISDYELTFAINEASTLEFDLTGDTSVADVGNYIYIEVDSRADLLMILTTEESLGTIHVVAEDGGVELINYVFPKQTEHTSHLLEYYALHFLNGSGFLLGDNESPQTLRTLKWSAEGTALSRLYSLATAYGVELQYSYEFEGLTLVNKYVNFRKRLGKDIGRTLSVGAEIASLTISKSIEDLATGFVVTGGTVDGSTEAINLTNLESSGYDDGDIFINKKWLLSRAGRDKWPRYGYLSSGTEGYLIKSFSYDTESPQELLTRAVAELRTACQPVVTYTVELSKSLTDITLGDSITVVDAEKNLSVGCRITKLKHSSDGDSYTLTQETEAVDYSKYSGPTGGDG